MLDVIVNIIKDFSSLLLVEPFSYATGFFLIGSAIAIINKILK